jgi:L-asparaginase
MLRGLDDEVDAELSTLDLFDLPSTFMTFEHMARLSAAVRQAVAEGVDGVVLTHGTDTLEESAYFVDLTTNGETPIVVTGAMIPPTQPSSDAYANLRDAIGVAASNGAAALGVVVVMAGQIHPARDVTKAHSMRLTAFTSGEFGPVGIVEHGRVAFFRSVARTRPMPVESIGARVELVRCCAGMATLGLQALIAAKVDGIVLETLGSGQVPPWIMDAVREAAGAGIVLAATTRCPAGRLVRQPHGLADRTSGGEQDLLDAGVLFSDLQGIKARIRLAVGLSAGLSPVELRAWF